MENRCMDAMMINLFEILQCFSDAVDMVLPEFAHHQHRVAMLAHHIAQQMELPEGSQRNVLMAGLVHDVGAISLRERMELIECEPVTVHSHGFRAARLLEEYGPFSLTADIVRYHHLPWEYGQGKCCMGRSVPVESHIVHLADRVCLKFRRDLDPLNQVDGIVDWAHRQSGEVFMPEVVDALIEISCREHVWLELRYNTPLDSKPAAETKQRLAMEDVLNLSRMFSRIIDFRSRFTATHSASVAQTAAKIAELVGFSRTECLQMLIACYLHDLGKLAIDTAILEKPGKLTAQEYNLIRSHTFITYHLLGRIKGFESIRRWAAFHHERLDGNGYPFQLMAEDIPVGARVMAVADVLSALTEPRPYRDGMSRERTVETLRAMTEDGALNRHIVSLALDNIDSLRHICLDSRAKA
jgi:HD-GYP domain-containing protein (c-di-GMP phosphodiesterase class II)